MFRDCISMDLYGQYGVLCLCNDCLHKQVRLVVLCLDVCVHVSVHARSPASQCVLERGAMRVRAGGPRGL